jgi:hypothetical protein
MRGVLGNFQKPWRSRCNAEVNVTFHEPPHVSLVSRRERARSGLATRPWVRISDGGHRIHIQMKEFEIWRENISGL